MAPSKALVADLTITLPSCPLPFYLFLNHHLLSSLVLELLGSRCAGAEPTKSNRVELPGFAPATPPTPPDVRHFRPIACRSRTLSAVSSPLAPTAPDRQPRATLRIPKNLSDHPIPRHSPTGIHSHRANRKTGASMPPSPPLPTRIPLPSIPLLPPRIIAPTRFSGLNHSLPRGEGEAT